MPDIFDASKNTKKTAEASVISGRVSKSAPEVLTKTEEAAAIAHQQLFDEEIAIPKRTARDVDEYSETMRSEKMSNNPFKSFLPKPSKIFFASQHSEEQVLLLLRRHPITQVGWFLTALLLAVVPFLFNAIGMLAFLPGNYQFAATIGWYLIIVGFALESFLSWFYNVYIITDERIIDVDFYNLLYHNISSAKLDNIEDITTEAGGVLASLFSFGTVKVQTAGSVTEFDFEDVPQPAKVTAFLNEMLLEEEREELEKRAN